MLLGERPPPLEALPHRHLKVLVPGLGLQPSDKVDDVPQRPRRPPVVGHGGDLAAVLQDGQLLGLRQPEVVEHLHPLRLAEDVVVERALGDPVLGAGLGEAHLLGYDSVDGLLQLALGPGWHLGALRPH